MLKLFFVYLQLLAANRHEFQAVREQLQVSPSPLCTSFRAMCAAFALRTRFGPHVGTARSFCCSMTSTSTIDGTTLWDPSSRKTACSHEVRGCFLLFLRFTAQRRITMKQLSPVQSRMMKLWMQRPSNRIPKRGRSGSRLFARRSLGIDT